MNRYRLALILLCLPTVVSAQQSAQVRPTSLVRLRIVPEQTERHRAVPAVAWLEPTAGTPQLPFPAASHYTLLQKNRMFVPHLQVVPVGSVVQFPNADPFFHNVFSLFDGKRFDLGLYEAGSSKAVTFSREGVSYIFCNIHPEMSAVILSLSTPLFAFADANNSIVLTKVPAGNYKLQVWVEGASPSLLSGMSRTVHVADSPVDLGEIKLPLGPPAAHDNKFGQPYDPVKTSHY